MPVPASSITLFRVIPPIATTGIETASHIALSIMIIKTDGIILSKNARICGTCPTAGRNPINRKHFYNIYVYSRTYHDLPE